MTFKIIFFTFLFLEAKCGTIVTPYVSTDLGVIQGLVSDNGTYKMFLGVPYATVNESNPFGPSTAHTGFNETFIATNDSAICPQSNGAKAYGELQCLNLNIYVPYNATSDSKLPVMVWIHGGAFVVSGATFNTTGPDYIVNKGVIMVTIQYRLGVYGFLCLGTEDVPGNQGLKDQVLGLKWIYENINAFGGDVNNITVFGNSAGGSAISLHILTNHTQYFQRAIIETGPAFTPWLLYEANTSIPLDLADSLGYEATNVTDAMSYLSSVDPLILAQKASDINITNNQGTNDPLIKVCVENKFDGVENFLVDYPMNINSSQYKSIPVMIGFNDNELSFQYGNAPNSWFENYSIADQLKYDIKNVDSTNIDILKHFYFGDQDLGTNVQDEITDFASDYIFVHPTERMIQKLMQNGSTDVFLYMFSYVGKRNYLRVELNLTTEGTAHADELGYLFVIDDLKNFTDTNDMNMVEILTTLWTNFAKTGNPTPEQTDLLPFTWTPVTNSTRPYLHLNSTVEMKTRPFAKRFAFWDLFYEINYKNLIGYEDN